MGVCRHMGDPKKTKSQNKDYTGRTVYILYVPGGAMHGVVPGVILSRLEELSGTPTGNLFQVLNGVSTGSLIVAGTSVRSDTDPSRPRYLASNLTELFCYWGNKFFPEIKGRMTKYATANILHYIQDATDPSNADKFLIQDLRENIQNLITAHNKKPSLVHDLIELRRLSSEKYFSKSRIRRAAKACEKLINNPSLEPEMKKTLEHINTLILSRQPISFLNIQFNKAANGVMNMTKRLWAKDYMYDPKIFENMLKSHLGDSRMSDALKSVYISSYDLENRKMVTFFNRKADLFSNAPDTPSVTSEHNEKLWDAVMASSANPLAFPPHKLEDGTICSDKAVIHTPLACLEDIVKNAPEGVNIKMIYVGTGKFKYEHEDDRYVNYGVLGNLMNGQEMDDLLRYTNSAAKQIIIDKLGEENFVELHPHLMPSRYEDLERMPTRNPLDASPENIKRLLGVARDYIQQEDIDRELKKLAFEMSDNLHKLGQMPDQKFEQVKKRCGYASDYIANDNQPNTENSDITRRVGGLIQHMNPRKWFMPK
jgi:hypothetical protein